MRTQAVHSLTTPAETRKLAVLMRMALTMPTPLVRSRMP
jgi:hypothetical protein